MPHDAAVTAAPIPIRSPVCGRLSKAAAWALFEPAHPGVKVRALQAHHKALAQEYVDGRAEFPPLHAAAAAATAPACPRLLATADGGPLPGRSRPPPPCGRAGPPQAEPADLYALGAIVSLPNVVAGAGGGGDSGEAVPSPSLPDGDEGPVPLPSALQPPPPPPPPPFSGVSPRHAPGSGAASPPVVNMHVRPSSERRTRTVQGMSVHKPGTLQTLLRSVEATMGAAGHDGGGAPLVSLAEHLRCQDHVTRLIATVFQKKLRDVIPPDVHPLLHASPSGGGSGGGGANDATPSPPSPPLPPPLAFPPPLMLAAAEASDAGAIEPFAIALSPSRAERCGGSRGGSRGGGHQRPEVGAVCSNFFGSSSAPAPRLLSHAQKRLADAPPDAPPPWDAVDDDECKSYFDGVFAAALCRQHGAGAAVRGGSAAAQAQQRPGRTGDPVVGDARGEPASEAVGCEAMGVVVAERRSSPPPPLPATPPPSLHRKMNGGMRVRTASTAAKPSAAARTSLPQQGLQLSDEDARCVYGGGCCAEEDVLCGGGGAVDAAAVRAAVARMQRTLEELRVVGGRVRCLIEEAEAAASGFGDGGDASSSELSGGDGASSAAAFSLAGSDDDAGGSNGSVSDSHLEDAAMPLATAAAEAAAVEAAGAAVASAGSPAPPPAPEAAPSSPPLPPSPALPPLSLPCPTAADAADAEAAGSGAAPASATPPPPAEGVGGDAADEAGQGKGECGGDDGKAEGEGGEEEEAEGEEGVPVWRPEFDSAVVFEADLGMADAFEPADGLAAQFVVRLRARREAVAVAPSSLRDWVKTLASEGVSVPETRLAAAGLVVTRHAAGVEAAAAAVAAGGGALRERLQAQSLARAKAYGEAHAAWAAALPSDQRAAAAAAQRRLRAGQRVVLREAGVWKEATVQGSDPHGFPVVTIGVEGVAAPRPTTRPYRGKEAAVLPRALAARMAAVDAANTAALRRVEAAADEVLGRGAAAKARKRAAEVEARVAAARGRIKEELDARVGKALVRRSALLMQEAAVAKAGAVLAAQKKERATAKAAVQDKEESLQLEISQLRTKANRVKYKKRYKVFLLEQLQGLMDAQQLEGCLRTREAGVQKELGQVDFNARLEKDRVVSKEIDKAKATVHRLVEYTRELEEPLRCRGCGDVSGSVTQLWPCGHSFCGQCVGRMRVEAVVEMWRCQECSQVTASAGVVNQTMSQLTTRWLVKESGHRNLEEAFAGFMRELDSIKRDML